MAFLNLKARFTTWISYSSSELKKIPKPKSRIWNFISSIINAALIDFVKD
jgi:hypothetical protein